MQAFQFPASSAGKRCKQNKQKNDLLWSIFCTSKHSSRLPNAINWYLKSWKFTFSGSNCKRTWFRPTIKWQKSCQHRRKIDPNRPKIDPWEITGCAQIQEIERPGRDANIQFQTCSCHCLHTFTPKHFPEKLSSYCCIQIKWYLGKIPVHILWNILLWNFLKIAIVLAMFNSVMSKWAQELFLAQDDHDAMSGELVVGHTSSSLFFFCT
jgi:hypothetical protein